MNPVDNDVLRDFVAHEARLLDEQRWEAWNDLFLPDGLYWVPADASHTDPQREASHLCEDALLRRVRIARLRHPQAHSQQPPGRCHHLLQASQVLERDDAAGRYHLRTPFLYTELRAGRTVQLPGVAWHRLQSVDGALRVRLKRVDLLHAAEPLHAVEFFV